MEAAWCGGKLGIQADGGVASSLDLTTKLATGILCFSWSLLPHANKMIALHLGLVMIQSNKIVNIQEL